MATKKNGELNVTMEGIGIESILESGLNVTFVIASGYFNPLHVGHLEYLQQARSLGNCLIVIVNNDEQVALKGSKTFMNERDRAHIVGSVKGVSSAIIASDLDGSVSQSLRYIVETIRKQSPENMVKPRFIFAKGGDRYKGEIPEAKMCKKLRVKIVDGLGKKIRSSSEILKRVQ